MSRRILLGAFGDPGHAFPMIALGRELAKRGHDVTLQTWSRWQVDVEREGMRFAQASEYGVFPTEREPLKPYEAVLRATLDTRPLVAELHPDVVVHDILTLAPALAAELEGVPIVTLVPHIYPPGEHGFPPYSLGARLPHTKLGRTLWRAINRPLSRGLRQGRDELNETRRRLGLPPLDHFHGGISQRLCIVATFPALEYPRQWPQSIHVVGPLIWEPASESVEIPDGDLPLILVAPSTAQDSEQRLFRAALEGLADLPVRVLASANRPLTHLEFPPNATVVEWLSYSQAMPQANLVITHGGHGTLVRALAAGCPVVVCPAGGDMYENAARAAWAGVGIRVPRRFVSAKTVRLATAKILSDAEFSRRAEKLRRWSDTHRPELKASELVEAICS